MGIRGADSRPQETEMPKPLAPGIGSVRTSGAQRTRKSDPFRRAGYYSAKYLEIRRILDFAGIPEIPEESLEIRGIGAAVNDPENRASQALRTKLHGLSG